jgi:inorganic pyrophosphatase
VIFERLPVFCYVLLLLTCRHDPPTRVVVGGAPISRRAIALDAETIMGQRHFSAGYPTRNEDGSVNAVIEIPAGTTGKFEVDDRDGWMKWKKNREDGKRREIDYLPFIVSYGMVPRTLAEDGDPLDVIVLGRGIERAHVAKTRVIGVLEMADAAGVRDDKLVAVPVEPELENGFSRLHELAELDELYPASREILYLWFANYWGQGVTNVLGWGDAAEAHEILERSKID